MNGQTFLKTLYMKNLKETLSFGQRFASILQQKDVVALQGDLGAGKSTFARAVIHSLCPAVDHIPSPTFTLIQSYDPANPLHGVVTHGDFWRLHAPEEVLELGLQDLFPQGISLIEWPERMGPFLPPQALFLEFTLPDLSLPEQRLLTLRGSLLWQERLAHLLTSFLQDSMS